MTVARTVIVEVQEGGGVPVPQYVELSNALARSEPGTYVVTIVPMTAYRQADRNRIDMLTEELCYIGPAGASRTAEEMNAKYRALRALYDAGDMNAAAQLELFDWLDHDLWATYGIIDTDKDPVLVWLEREAAAARRVLEAEEDPGNIETMKHWTYLHECLVRKRLDEMGLLDADDDQGGEWR